MIRAAASFALAVLLALAPGATSCADEIGVVKFSRKGESPGSEGIAPAIFPHGVHRVAFKCAACHDDLFPMRSGSVEITMEMIQEGKSCGACHNGTIAFASSIANCSYCHRE